MAITAAVELAGCIADNKIRPNRILPTMDDWKIFPQVAAAVGMRAQKESCRQKMSKDALFKQAEEMIKRSRGITQTMMQKGYIKSKIKCVL